MICVRLPRLLEFKETGNGGGQVPSELSDVGVQALERFSLPLEGSLPLPRG